MRSFVFKGFLLLLSLLSYLPSEAQSVPPGYYSYDQIVAIADSLAQAYPAICRKNMLGTSLGGRQVFALKISDNPGLEEDEPEILFDGGIHGDEIGGSQNLIMYARDLCRKYNQISLYTDLINSRQIWLLVMVNPDGRENMVRYNNAGVDINRDFGYMWGNGGTSPYAFSQVETRILRDLMLNHRFTIYTNYHSGTEILSYPWSYRPQSSRDNAILDTLAKAYSQYSGYNGLLYGQGFNIMYQIFGSTKDFVYGGSGTVGWSMEISDDKQPPASQIALYYNKNLGAMNEMVNRSGWGIHGRITDSLSGMPVNAIVRFNSLYPVTTKPGIGNFYKYLIPGTYTVTVTANGYAGKTISGVIVPQSGSTEINVQLVQQTGFFVNRVMTCQIPNSNFGDEAYTPGCTGPPDNIPYSIGHNGTVVVDMGDTIYDGPGNDFRVWEAGYVLKSYTCYGSLGKDGPWTLISNAISTHDFDLQPSGMQKIRYLKIVDGGTAPSTGAGAGFNFDAVEMLNIPLRANYMAGNRDTCQGAYIRFSDITLGTVTSRQWDFPGGIPSSSTEKDPLVFYGNPGEFPVSLRVANDYCVSSRTDSAFIRINPDPAVDLGPDTLLCNWASIILDAGNPGSAYLWSTGETTRTILVDTSSVSAATDTISVIVTSATLCSASDTVIVSFQPCPGIAEMNETGISLSPNPSGGPMSLSYDWESEGHAMILDSKGIPVSHFSLPAGKNRIMMDFSGLSDGLYLFYAQSGSLNICRKFIIRHQ